MTVSLTGSVLTLVGVVGEDDGWGEGISHGEVVRALSEIDDAAALTVHLNSPGGICDEGSGIYNALRARRGQTHVIVHGVALSCGSLIAMAGNRISMTPGSVMMLHDVRVGLYATAADLPGAARHLETWNASMASAYALRTGKAKAAIRAMMVAETWFDPDEAVASKFADDVIESRAGARPAAFAYASAFKHPPQHLVTMATTNGWNGRPRPTEQKEPDVSQEKPALGNAVAQATARIKGIMKHAEAEGRADLAEHLAYETEMTVEAAGAILAKAPKSDASMSGMDMYDALRSTDLNPDQQRRLNAEGLNGSRPLARGRVDLVAAMKRRHGIK